MKTVSAPGKVLVSGGYLVLDENEPGVVLATSARFYARLTLNPKRDCFLKVTSPQFHTSYKYQLNRKDLTLELDQDSRKDNFIDTVVKYTFLVIRKWKDLQCSSLQPIQVEMKADNDFYSQILHLQKQNRKPTRKGLRELDNFMPQPLDENGKVCVHKTGLGSSAALTTSLAAVLLEYFGVIQWSSPNSADLQLVHRLTQALHFIAQGKIGSGFDVSAAVFGHQVYQRGLPLDTTQFMDSDGHVDAAQLMHCIQHGDWPMSMNTFQLPIGMQLVMGDICGGSKTVDMVKKVLKWKTRPESKGLWQELSDSNRLFQQYMVQWSLMDGSVVSPTENSHTNIKYVIESIRRAHRRMRIAYQKIGEEAGVDIEPKEQRILADATNAISGVLVCGIPGAGGHDAIYALTMDDKAVHAVEELWENWSSPGITVCPLQLSAETGDHHSGLRLESTYI